MNPELCPLNKMQHIFFSIRTKKSRPVYKKIDIFLCHISYTRIYVPFLPVLYSSLPLLSLSLSRMNDTIKSPPILRT